MVKTKVINGQARAPRPAPDPCNVMNNVVYGATLHAYPEIMRHHESFGFVPGNRSLSAAEVGLVNVTGRETARRQYVDSVKRDHNYVLLNLRPLLGTLTLRPVYHPKILAGMRYCF